MTGLPASSVLAHSDLDAATSSRSESGVIAFLAFIGILMAFGIDAALPAYDELSLEFELDARHLSPAIVGTVYFIGMAVGQMFFGVLADRFGRRPILIAGIGLYGVAATVAALSVNLEMLLIARFMWGVGASAPTVVRFAIARDLFEGDRMARVITTVTAVFLIGPILVPIAGEGILLVGSWRTIFIAAVGLGVVALGWTIRFGETLSPDARRPARFGPLIDACVAVVRTRLTLWIIVAQVFFSASFFIWLGSAQPILDEVYGRDAQFTVFFGLSGVGMALALLFNKRLIERYGTRTMSVRAAVALVAVGVVGCVVTLAADGLPSVWAWFAWAVVANALTTIITPMSTAMALEPMADKAGTVSAVLGLAQLGGGALLAAIVDARIDTTVTPMLVGSLAYGIVGLACLLIGVRGVAARDVQPPLPSTVRLGRIG